MFVKASNSKYLVYDVDYYDTVRSLWVWHCSSEYYISSYIGFRKRVDTYGYGNSNETYPENYLFNGELVYRIGWPTPNSGTVMCYFWTFGGVYYATPVLGFKPYFFNNNWSAGWWQSSSAGGPYKLYNEDTYPTYNFVLTALTTVSGWTRSGGVIGVYTRAGQPDKTIGWNILQDENIPEPITTYCEFIQEIEMYNGHDTYNFKGNLLWYNTSTAKYIISATIGIQDPLLGYWWSSTLLGTYTFVFTGSFGLRADLSEKGWGYFGVMIRPDGAYSTEMAISTSFDNFSGEIPLLVPALTDEEITYLLAGGIPTETIINKAIANAVSRLGSELSPFASLGEQTPREGFEQDFNITFKELRELSGTHDDVEIPICEVALWL